MEGLKKQILFRLFCTPGVVIPFGVGVSLLLLAEILGPMFAFVGFCSLLLGIGAFSTNLLFNLGVIIERASQDLINDKMANTAARLDALDQKLVRDRDPRDQEALRNLRAIYEPFMEDLALKKLSGVPELMLKQIEDFYNAIIRQLDTQFQFWETSCKVTGELKEKILEQRNALIIEIQDGVENLIKVISEVRALGLSSVDGVNELSQLQDRLSSQLEIAKGVSNRLREFNDLDGLNKYAEYEKG